MVSKRLFGPVEIALIAGIIVFGSIGVVYAGLSGIVGIPGVPTILADKPVAPPQRSINVPLPSPSEDAATTPDATPVPSISPLFSPIPTSSVAAIETPSPAVTTQITPTPEPTALPSPTPDPQQQAKDRDTQRLTVLIPQLQVALTAYKAKHKAYPISAEYTGSWTDLASSPLQVLVKEGFISTLPTDPLPSHHIGYLSSAGKNYSISVALEDTSHPGGSFSTDPSGQQVYLYIVSSP